MTIPSNEIKRVRVWDLPTRLFHWTLAVLVAFSWWSGEQGGSWLNWNFLSGFAVVTLVLFRIVWGLVGSTTARFGHFIKGPRAGIAHLREMFSAHVPRDFGHNAVGGWVIVAMLALLAAQAGLGMFAEDEVAHFGPFNGYVSADVAHRLTKLHHLGGKLILYLVVLHVFAVIVYFVWKRLNLVGPMLSGYSRASDGDANAKFVSPWWALLIIVLAGLCVWGIVSLGK